MRAFIGLMSNIQVTWQVNLLTCTRLKANISSDVRQRVRGSVPRTDGWNSASTCNLQSIVNLFVSLSMNDPDVTICVQMHVNHARATDIRSIFMNPYRGSLSEIDIHRAGDLKSRVFVSLFLLTLDASSFKFKNWAIKIIRPGPKPVICVRSETITRDWNSPRGRTLHHRLIYLAHMSHFIEKPSFMHWLRQACAQWLCFESQRVASESHQKW
jgi:hypothetical protein